jgi:uncharacterized protein YndB with AHSA1/START domain
MPMTKPSFVYVTYIATTPEKVWQAFVDTDVMREYWIGPSADCARVNVSDWRPGSRWEHQRTDDARTVDIVGKVVESNPPRRLVFTWARPGEAGDDRSIRVDRHRAAWRRAGTPDRHA